VLAQSAYMIKAVLFIARDIRVDSATNIVTLLILKLHHTVNFKLIKALF
jgi:hypothetical protein